MTIPGSLSSQRSAGKCRQTLLRNCCFYTKAHDNFGAFSESKQATEQCKIMQELTSAACLAANAQCHQAEPGSLS